MPLKFNPIRKAKHLLEPGEGLHQRTIRSGAWVFAIRIASQGFSFVRLIIIARILAPDDFGLFGIAMLAMATLSTFTATGFSSALIQKKGRIEDYLNTAWTVTILRGAAIFTILFFAAPYVATFFNAPETTNILRVIGISTLLGGFANIGVVYFEKELEYNKQFFYELSSMVADFVVVVSTALILRSVWALVFGLLASSIVKVIVSYRIHPYRPRFSLDLGKAKELFAFGKWILGSAVVVFLFSQGDDGFVGKLLGVASLGLYRMAYQISNTPTSEVASVFSRVTFPVYSKLQDNLPGLRQAYLKVLQLNAFLSIPLAAGIFMLAPEFTQIVLTAKWLPVVPALQVLVLFGVLRSISATTSAVFRGVGKPQIVTRWDAIRLGVLVAVIYPLTIQWGIMGTSIAVVLAQLVATVGFSYMVIKITECGVKDFSRLIGLPLISTAIMVLLLWGLKATFLTVSIGQFILLILAGIATYFGATYLLDRFCNYGMRPLIKESLKSLRGS